MEFTPYKITETLNYMFYQIPMELFFNTNYKDALSLEAKVLYGLLLSQLTLSIKNNWQDENGDVYINGNELNLSCDVEVTYVSKSSKINYCPMCGRKLTEE